MHVGSRAGRQAAWVGVVALPARSGGLPPDSLLSSVAVLVPGKPVGGRESLTSLPVNNDFLLGADPSGVSHQKGQLASAGEVGTSGMREFCG